uniref:VWFA domain-containing protein n=1 Tax=Chrysemys picta bellii TaxID=8478 RepID=A0A8C3FJ62_CHRPI
MPSNLPGHRSQQSAHLQLPPVPSPGWTPCICSFTWAQVSCQPVRWGKAGALRAPAHCLTFGKGKGSSWALRTPGFCPQLWEGSGDTAGSSEQSHSQEGLAPQPPPVAPSPWGKLIYVCLTPAALAPSCGFSVDVEGPITFQEAARGFGQSVVQFGSPYVTCLISTPEGPIWLGWPPNAVNMSLGLSLAARGSNLLVCGPTVHRVCGENMYVNGYCFLLDQSLRQRQRIPDTLAECPRRVTDIALLIDGSGSIIPENFRKMKTFISEIMKRFRSTDTQFALMQYSNRFRKHFDFFQYRRSRDPDDLVRAVVQLKGWTHTATAIQKVARELFTSGRGARDEATKVLIVITDGKKISDPLSYSDAVPEAERAGIIRYGVSHTAVRWGPDSAFSLSSIMLG